MTRNRFREDNYADRTKKASKRHEHNNVIDYGLFDDIDEKENDVRFNSSTRSDNSKPETEYEYVSVSEFMSSVSDFIREHFVPISIIAIIIVGALLLNIGKRSSVVFIALGLVIIIVAFAFMIYGAWVEKVEAEEKRDKALDIMRPVKWKLRGQHIANDEHDDSK